VCAEKNVAVYTIIVVEGKEKVTKTPQVVLFSAHLSKFTDVLNNNCVLLL
jgi:hypothetical protein